MSITCESSDNHVTSSNQLKLAHKKNLNNSSVSYETEFFLV